MEDQARDEKASHEVVDTWCVRGPFTDAAVTNTEIEELATTKLLTDGGNVDLRVHLTWTVTCSEFGWSLSFEGVRLHQGVLVGSAQPCRDVLLEGRWIQTYKARQRRRMGLDWRKPCDPSPEERFEPALLLRRDARGLSLDEFLATSRQRAQAHLQALGMNEGELAALPEELVEAVLSVVTADESGRILEKLRIKPELLVAVGIILGGNPEHWAPEGRLADPLHAIRAGAKERAVLSSALVHHEALRTAGGLTAGLDHVTQRGRLQLAGPTSPLAFAKVLRAHPVPLGMVAAMWRSGASPTWIPDDATERCAWVVALRACKTFCTSPRAMRYAARHGVALHDLFARAPGTAPGPTPHGFFRELAEVGYPAGRSPSPRTVVTRSRAKPFPPLASIDRVVEIEGFTFRRMGDTNAIRALGRKYENCLAGFERHQVARCTTIASAYFEVTWNAGACVTSLTVSEQDMEVTCRGPSNADVPAEVAAHIERVLRDSVRSAHG